MAPVTDQTEICSTCNRSFEDWDAFLKHKICSPKHPYACVICGSEFQSENAQKSHEHQFHVADQNLTCIGCGEEFNRCGSYVDHIEMGKCSAIRKETFDKLRGAKHTHHQDNTNQPEQTAADHIDRAASILTGSSPTVDILTAFDSPTKAAEFELFKMNFPALKLGDNKRAALELIYETEPIEVHDEVDPEEFAYMAAPEEPLNHAIGEAIEEFDPNMDANKANPKEASHKLKYESIQKPLQQDWNDGGANENNADSKTKENVVWGKSTSNVLHSPPNNSPPLRSRKLSGPLPELSGSSYFRPSQPSKLRPTTLTRSGPDLSTLQRNSTLLKSIQEGKMEETEVGVQIGSGNSTIPVKYFHKYDPDQPGFNLDKYRNVYSGKYRCAFPGCTKLQNTRHGLYQHLKSNAHLSEICKCPVCSRTFTTSTALIQHLESAPSSKCGARDDPRFRQIIEQAAGGVLDIAGTHIDDTPRYYSSKVLPKMGDTREAFNDPEYRAARERERGQMMDEQTARIMEWKDNDEE